MTARAGRAWRPLTGHALEPLLGSNSIGFVNCDGRAPGPPVMIG